MVDHERIASVLLDATMVGDRTAARRWGVSERTVWRYRSRMRQEPELAEVVRRRLLESEAELGAMRVRFLRKALAEMERRLDQPDTTLEGISEAVRVVGEMHATMSMMEGDEGSDGSDPEADEAARDGAGNASVSAAGPH